MLDLESRGPGSIPTRGGVIFCFYILQHKSIQYCNIRFKTKNSIGKIQSSSALPNIKYICIVTIYIGYLCMIPNIFSHHCKIKLGIDSVDQKQSEFS